MYMQEQDQIDDKIADLSGVLQGRNELKETIYMLYWPDCKVTQEALGRGLNVGRVWVPSPRGRSSNQSWVF